MNQQEILYQKYILQQMEEVIQQGPFQDNWQSLCKYTTPRWYQDAKFGIFIHWGVYSVPAFGNEWYPRNMYIKDSIEYEYHRKIYGSQDRFGYKDFIPMFKAEHFNAAEWMDLVLQSGARYVMPVAEHHDGFQMYNSQLSRYNAVNMGPGRDIIGELKTEAEKRGIIFALSNHRAEHCWFFNGGLHINSDVREYGDFYDCRLDPGQSEAFTHDIFGPGPDPEHLENWLARLCELVDRYQPRIIWFDWWIQNVAFRPYLKKFAAYYYNRASQWNVEVAINYKYAAFMQGSAIFDVERGQLSGIQADLWQTDTSVAKNSWGYTKANEYKDPSVIIGDLVDIVSKNGCLLLNIGPRADGTIPEEDQFILREIGNWLNINGEGIYATRSWKVFGEGPTFVGEGAFSDTIRSPFTSNDIRYTYKTGIIYAFVMQPPQDGIAHLKLLARHIAHADSDYNIYSVRVLGNKEVHFERDQTEMRVFCGTGFDKRYPICLKISID